MTIPININQNSVVSSSDRSNSNLKKVASPSTKVNIEANAFRLVETKTTKAEKEDSTNVEQVELSAEQKKTSEQTLDKAVKELNTHFQSVNRNLTFNIDDELGRTIVRITDTETDELIRQIPHEDAVRIAKNLKKEIQLNNEASFSQGVLLTELKA